MISSQHQERPVTEYEMREPESPPETESSTHVDVAATEAYGHDPVGDTERAFLTLLFNKYRGPLYRYLTTLVPSAEDASDILQESYFRLLRRGSLIQIDGLARAYLFETARNLARDHLRRLATHHASSHQPIDECDLRSEAATPDSAVALQQTLALLSEAILELADPARSVFLMSRYRSMSHVEIGRALGISIRSVERRMAEALEQIASRLGVVP